MARRLDQLDDTRLAKRVHAGDEAAFEVLYDRHHRALLSFCRHMLGNAEDGEDAVQQTFLRAHRALRAGQLPDAVRPWLFAIARNRCKTLLAARREACVPMDDFEPSFDGLADGVAVRDDLRQLVSDLGRLPEDQRAALVLFELGGLSQAEIAGAIGVASGKVKALVFQARAELMAERDARSTPCESIREELAVARGGALRRGPLRRHLRHCEPCQAYRAAVATQRAGLASVLPVAPAVGLKAAVLAPTTGSGGAGLGAAGGGAATAVATKVAVVVALVGGGAGAGVAADRQAQPAGANAAAVVTVTPTPTPTVIATATATATVSPPPETKRSRAAGTKPRRVSEPAPSATPATTPTSEPAATRTPEPVATAAAVAGKQHEKSRQAPKRESAVRGIVREKAPAVTGEVSEPVPTPAPKQGRGQRPRRLRPAPAAGGPKRPRQQRRGAETEPVTGTAAPEPTPTPAP